MSGCLKTETRDLVYCQSFEDLALTAGTGRSADGRVAMGELVAGVHGQALHVPALKPGAFVSLLAGIVGLKGCAEFWAKLDNGAGSYTSIFDPAFFIIRSPDCPGFYPGWSANEGHGMSGVQFHT